MTGWRCTPWRSASGATSTPRGSRSWRWAASPTPAPSRRGTGRTGSTSRWPGSTTSGRRPCCGAAWRRRVSADALEPHGPERLGFYACSTDLEDELIRALGVDGVEAVIEAAGEAQSLRLLAGMPAQRGWTRVALLRRFLGSQSGRKARYAALFVRALAPGQAPEPLAALLARVQPDRPPAATGDRPGIRGW